MKPLFVFAAVLVLSPATLVMAAEAATEKPSAEESKGVESDLKTLVDTITKKVRGGSERTEKEFAKELAEFDAIIARHKDEKADVLAEVLIMKAAVYLQLLEDPAKAEPILEEIGKKYPGTKPAAAATQMLSGIERQKAAAKVQASLKIGAPFPPIDEKDLNGKPLSTAALKGKVVLVDFWATWCPPCVAELPNVLAAYKKYHDKGFEIIGISLDEDRGALDAFLKKEEMPWPQYFDGKGWENAVSQKYGIMSIPATFLLDGEGKIIGRDLRGDELGKAVAKAVGAK